MLMSDADKHLHSVPQAPQRCTTPLAVSTSALTSSDPGNAMSWEAHATRTSRFKSPRVSGVKG